MRINRFFIEGVDLNIGGKIRINDPEILNQVRNVLRFKMGDEFMVCDGRLNEARVRLARFDKNSFEVEVLDISKNQNEPARRVILYCSILKKENFGLVAQKATEIGISEIVPIITERTVKLSLNMERLQKIVREAAEQSGRGIVPTLHEPVDFPIAVRHRMSDSYGSSVNIFLDQSGVLFSSLRATNHGLLTTIWVGPEGGWIQDELELATKKGFFVVSFGHLTFRAETAAICGVFHALYL